MKFKNFFIEIYKGKTIGRILLNNQIKISCTGISGRVLDLAGGGRASYYRYLPENVDYVQTDSTVKEGVVRLVDFNKPLPYAGNEFDSVLFFNALYIAENRAATLLEIKRVLKNGAILYLSSPLLVGEIPEPVDYCRLTSQGLQKELNEAGFSNIEIIRIGGHFTAVANLLHPFYIFNTVRLAVYGLSTLLDRMVPRSLKERHPVPLEYLCVIKKDAN